MCQRDAYTCYEFALTLIFHRMDVHEDAQSNTVTATFELPGLKKEDVNIDVRNNLLTISGESKISEERDENGYAVRERRFGRFMRSIPLPQGVKVSTWSPDSYIRIDTHRRFS